MRVLITGAGLIGTHTAKELAERNDQVTFFDFAPRPDYIRHVTGQELPVIRGDIRDLAALGDAFQRVRPECVRFAIKPHDPVLRHAVVVVRHGLQRPHAREILPL